MAIAATWVISTARSPTTWQPNILQVVRSTISLQKPERAPVDDRARGRVEVDNRGHDIVCFTGLRFGEAHLGIFRVREAADRAHRVPKRHRRASHGVGSRHEAVLYRLRDQHQATGDIPSGEDMRRGRPQIPIDLHEPPMIGLDARR